MPTTRPFAFLLLTLALLALPGSQCIIDDDDAVDDDDAADDDDVVADDDDAVDDDDSGPQLFQVEGDVIALNRETGEVLTLSEAAALAGKIVVYAAEDPDDLTEVLGKSTLDGPDHYEIELLPGPDFHLVAVADSNRNSFIDSYDVARRYAFNPVSSGGPDVEEADIYIDLLVPDEADDDDSATDDDDSSWEPPTPCEAVFDGDVNLLPPWQGDTSPVAVTSNTLDPVLGPLRWTSLEEAGPWELGLACFTSARDFLGYLDADRNDLFEPCDPVGEAPANPFWVGDVGVSGVQVDIPVLGLKVPAPPPFVPITGTVVYPSFTTGDVLVRATHVTIDGYAFSAATLAAPGSFSLIAPPATDDVLVWAVLDEDGDGQFDISVDPFDSEGPMNTGTGVTGIQLDLGDAPGGTISVLVTWEGALGADDELHVGVFDSPVYDPASGPPPHFVVEEEPFFPYPWDVEDVDAGTWWVGSYLDIGGDDPNSPGPEDPGVQVGPVLLPPGGELDLVVPLPLEP